MQPVLDVEAGGDARAEELAPRWREPAALRSDADERRRRPEAERGVDRPHDRDVAVRLAGVLRVEDGDDRIATVVDDAAGGLPVMGVARATLSEDQEPFVARA